MMLLVRSKLVYIAASIAVFWVALLLADRALGMTGFPSEPPLTVGHRPNFTEERTFVDFTYTIRTNNRGIRYRDIPEKKSADEFRVVVLGDSFTEGKGVAAEETWPALLETDFKKSAPAKESLFINCGLIGAGPAQYARVLKHVGLEYGPDLVLLVLFANDVADTPMVSDADLRSGEGWLADRTSNPERKGAQAVFHTVLPRIDTLLSAAKDSFKNNLLTLKPKNTVRDLTVAARRQGISQERIDAWKKRLLPEWVRAADKGHLEIYVLAQGLLRPDVWVEALDLSTPASERKWDIAKAMLSRIRELCLEKRVPLAVVYAPSPYQYDPAYVSPAMRLGVTFREEWLIEESESEKRFGIWAAENNLPFLNLTPVFRKEASQRPGVLQFKTDLHWTPEGNRLAADAIKNWLLQNKLLPIAESP